MTQTSKPEWVGQYGTSYDEMVRSWGFEVEDSAEFGSYQGDLVYVLWDGGRVGLVIIGYGSCSGCDSLEAAQPWDEDGDWTAVSDLSDKLRGDVHWEPSRPAMAAWIGKHPENHWWSYDDEIQSWLSERFPAEVVR